MCTNDERQQYRNIKVEWRIDVQCCCYEIVSKLYKVEGFPYQV